MVCPVNCQVFLRVPDLFQIVSGWFCVRNHQARQVSIFAKLRKTAAGWNQSSHLIDILNSADGRGYVLVFLEN